MATVYYEDSTLEGETGESAGASAGARPVRRAEILLLGAVLVIGGVLRVYRLDAESVWYDELISVQSLNLPTFREFLDQERRTDPAMMPTYFFLEYSWWHRISNSEYSLRWLSIGFGLATIVLLWWTGRTLFDPRAGLTAALCLAFAQLHIYQSQEIRMYALTYLLALAAMFAFLRALDTGRRAWWVGNWVFNGLLVWTHFLGILVLLTQGLAMAWVWRRRIPALLGWTVCQSIFLMPIPLWYGAMERHLFKAVLSWIPLPSLVKVSRVFYGVFSGSMLSARQSASTGTLVPFLGLVASATVWALAGYFLFQTLFHGKRSSSPARCAAHRRALLVLALWCVVPTAALCALSYVGRPSFVERYVFHSALALFLAAGAGMAALPKSWMRLAACLVLIAAFAGIDSRIMRPLRLDVRTAAAIIREKSVAGEPVYIRDPYNTGLAFSYYARLPQDRLIVGKDFVERATASMKDRKAAWLLHPGGAKSIARRLKKAGRQSGMAVDEVVLAGRRNANLWHMTPDDSTPPKRREKRKSKEAPQTSE